MMDRIEKLREELRILNNIENEELIESLNFVEEKEDIDIGIGNKYYHMSYEEFDKEFSKENPNWREVIIPDHGITKERIEKIKNYVLYMKNVVEQYDNKLDWRSGSKYPPNRKDNY
jgi:hypothetical protein